MVDKLQDDNQESLEALFKLLKITAKQSASITFYAAALGAIVIGGGLATLPASVTGLIGLIGVNALGEILKNVVYGDKTEDELRQALMDAIEASGIQNALTFDDFQTEVGRLMRDQNHLRYAIKYRHAEVIRRLDDQIGEYRILNSMLAEDLAFMRQQLASIDAKVDKIDETVTGIDDKLSYGQFVSADPWLLSYNKSLVEQLEKHIRRDFKEIKAAWNKGQRSVTLQWLDDLFSGDTRHSISKPIYAEILRYRARIEISLSGDASKVRIFSDQAREIDPQTVDHKLEAWIVRLTQGSEPAISLLTEYDSTDDINLRAVFLIEVGEHTQAKGLLQTRTRLADTNAETWRLLSFLSLTDRNIEKAQDYISQAIALEPEWENIRFTYACIQYFSALSPAVIPNGAVIFPEPVDWELVKQDDNARHHIIEAAGIFEQLSQIAENDGDVFRKHQFTVWMMVCWANLEDTQIVAADICRELVNADPTFAPAIAWGLVRHYQIDWSRSIQELETLVHTGKATFPQITALAHLYDIQKRTQEATKLLKNSRSIFEASEQLEVWISWYIRSLAIERDYITARQYLTNLVEGRTDETQFQKMLLRVNALESGDWTAFIAYLEKRYVETNDVLYLYELCEICATQEYWDKVSDHAIKLVEQIQTAGAVRLAAICAFNGKHYQLCIQLLDDNLDMFAQKLLPKDLQRLRILSLRGVGNLTEAVAAAKQRADEEATSGNLLDYISLLSLVGDIETMAIVARNLEGKQDVEATEALQIANLIFTDDHNLATYFWHYAVQKGLPDEALGPAMHLAFRLKLDHDDDLGAVFNRLMTAEQQDEFSGLQPAQNILKFIQMRNEQTKDLVEKYKTGLIPIHWIAGQGNIPPLEDLYHFNLEAIENSADYFRSGTLLIRHGGHRLVQGFPQWNTNWRLYLDITTVLLAQHLNVFGKLSLAFGQLFLPDSITPAILAMEDRKRAAQPSKFDDYRAIMQLVDAQRIQVVDPALSPDFLQNDAVEEVGVSRVALLEFAQKHGGLMVDFLPIHKNDLSGEVSHKLDEFIDYFINCKSIIWYLKESNHISVSEFEAADRIIDPHGHELVKIDFLKLGVNLVFFANTIEVLASTGLLPIVSTLFQTATQREEVERIRSELQTLDVLNAQANWLRDLAADIRREAENGRIKFVPAVSKVEEDDKTPESIEFASLRTLLLMPHDQRFYLCVDDRWTTGYAHTDKTAHIIGINEVLKVLAAHNVISLSEYYSLLIRMRSANLKFIPVHPDEIVYHLKQSHIVDRNLQATRSLIILRDYVRSCLSSHDILQKPAQIENNANEQGEAEYISQLSTSIARALYLVWAGATESPTEKQIRSDWIMDNLYFDHTVIYGLTGLSHFATDNHYSYWLLLSQPLLSLGGPNKLIRKQYFEWLANRIVDPVIRKDPSLIENVCELLKRTTISTRNEVFANLYDIATINTVVRDYVEDLPAAILEKVSEDQAFVANINMTSIPIIEIDHEIVLSPDYWNEIAAQIVRNTTDPDS